MTTYDGLLQAILDKCDRGDCPDDRWPDPKGNYRPLSPLRADGHSGSFAIGPKGFMDFASGDKGGLHDLAERLGVSVAVLQRCAEGTHTHTLTLAAYAEAKALPDEFLSSLGVVESTYRG